MLCIHAYEIGIKYKGEELKKNIIQFDLVGLPEMKFYCVKIKTY